MTDTKVYPKCNYVANGERCGENAIYDGFCGTHATVVEEQVQVREEIVNLLHEFDGVASKEIITDEIMNRIIGRLMDNFAEMYLAQAKGLRLNAKISSGLVRERLIARAQARAATTELVKAQQAERGLRQDFGELAKDLKKSINLLAAKLGGDTDPAMEALHSWRATAEILADKELADRLANAKQIPVGDFGPVPRPEGS